MHAVVNLLHSLFSLEREVEIDNVRGERNEDGFALDAILRHMQ